VNYAAAMADTKQVGLDTVITYDANDSVHVDRSSGLAPDGEQLQVHVIDEVPSLVAEIL
jgi:hypothetical protein